MRSAQPRPSWPAPERQQPVYTKMELALADMKADAAQINKRFRGNSDKASRHRPTKPRSTIPARIMEFLRSNPGATPREVEAAIGEDIRNTRAALLRMTSEGRLRRWRDSDDSRVPYRYEVAQ